MKAWTPLVLPKGPKEPAPKVERAVDNATSGKHSLKVTFAGGTLPTIATTRIPDDWMAWETFKVDGIVNRDCVMGFTVMQEASTREPGWEGSVSRWCLAPESETAHGLPEGNPASAFLPAALSRHVAVLTISRAMPVAPAWSMVEADSPRTSPSVLFSQLPHTARGRYLSGTPRPFEGTSWTTRN